MLTLNVPQDVQQRIQEQRASMKDVLEDTRLVTLQREGGAVLARMRREEFRFPQSEDYRYQIISKSTYVLLLIQISTVFIESSIVQLSFDLHCSKLIYSLFFYSRSVQILRYLYFT